MSIVLLMIGLWMILFEILLSSFNGSSFFSELLLFLGISCVFISAYLED